MHIIMKWTAGRRVRNLKRMVLDSLLGLGMRFWNLKCRDASEKWSPAIVKFGSGLQVDDLIFVGINIRIHAF